MNQHLLPRATLYALTLFASLALSLPARAQWLTQSFVIKPGWNAIYLFVDASYQRLDQMIGSDPNNPISEVWLWQAPSTTLQFVTSPQSPVAGGSQWANWARANTGIVGNLLALQPNAAYLIHSVGAANYTWKVQGKPVAPAYSWNSSGLNFLGFPTLPANPPPFDAFLALGPAFADLGNLQIFQYTGGDLGTNNPSLLLALHTTPVTRGQAFWIRTGSYNSYFGPFQVALTSSGGVDFSNTVSQASFRLQNLTATNVTVTLNLTASESPPPGQTPIVGLPPLLVRGALNTSNLTYGFSSLVPGSGQSWTLAPQGQSGSDIIVVLGLNRYAMANNPGDRLAGILRLTDSFNFCEVDVPVSAVMGSLTGLWVGNATVSQVANYMKTYQTDANNNPVVSSNGNYIVSSINTNLGPVVQPYSLRLIMHNSGTNVALLQRVFYGLDVSSNAIVATTEAALDPAQLGSARRISATHLPVANANPPWPFSGQIAQGGTLTTTVTTTYDDQSSNPFLHTYHPDHDNLDATFQNQLPQGSESYQITRQISLNILPPGNDFASLTTAGQTLSGNYAETISLGGMGGFTRTFSVAGAFSLNCITTIPVLTQP
jgi:hypothetical protein